MSAPLFSGLAFKALAHFMAARYAALGVRVGLFEHLARGPATLDELARDLAMPRRTTRMLADALVASELLLRPTLRYRNSPLAQALLAGTSPLADLRPLAAALDRLLAEPAPGSTPAWWAGLRGAGPLRLWEQVLVPQWSGLERSLRTDTATFALDTLDTEQHRTLATAVAWLSASAAQALALAYPFGGHQRLLDLGGGTGTFLLAALRRHPHLDATLFELPQAAELAAALLAAEPATRTVRVVAGDLFADPLPAGHDLILLANLAHLFAPERNQALLRRIRQAAAPGARLLLVDFWTDRRRTRPPLAALMAGAFQTISGEGDVYSAEEARAWLAACGWSAGQPQLLAGPLSLIAADRAEGCDTDFG